MKFFLITATLVTAAISFPAYSADVGLSLSIGQPGFFGQIDIGNFGRPQLIYRQPVVIERVSVDRPPIYLHVPRSHARNWRRHCREYNACGERVYFVNDNWYKHQYVPRYQKQQRELRGEHNNDQRGGKNQNQRGNDRNRDN